MYITLRYKAGITTAQSLATSKSQNMKMNRYLFPDGKSSPGSANHSSLKSSVAVGLSRGSSFIIFPKNALSSFEISASLIR